MTTRDASSAHPSTGEDPVSALSRLWQLGERPDLVEYLERCGPLDEATLVAVLRVDQMHRWQSGERIPVEAYFRLCPNLETTAEPALELIYSEYLLREGPGERPLLSEFALRFPLHAERLRQQIELHQAIDAEPSLTDNTEHKEAVESVAARNDETWKNTPAAGEAPGAAANAVPGYEILRLLGRGGMGVVYLARQTSLNRRVALKMLPGGPVDPEERARFRVEAETVARMQHPHIVQIYEVGQCTDRPYFALEYVDGGSLAQHLAGRPQPPRDAARLVETLARAIHYAHQRGVVHRDLKPANVLLVSGSLVTGSLMPGVAGTGEVAPDTSHQSPGTRHQTPKITDFGLAKLLDRRERAQTQTGAVLGTPSYMSPEQALGRTRDIGTPTDVYALGAMLYEALTGRPPFEADSSVLTLQQVAHSEPVPPRQLQPSVPRDLDTICLKCLEKDPARRYGSAEALADDLRRFLAGDPIQARRVGGVERVHKWARRHPALAGLLAVAVLSTVLLAGGGWWAYVQLRKSAAETQQSFQDALDAVDQMLTEVADVDLDEIPQMETKRRELLQRAQAFYDHLLSRRDDDPRLQLENIHARIRTGDIHFVLGESQEALGQIEDALARLASYRGSDRARALQLRADALRKRGLVQKSQSQLTQAEGSLRDALAIHEQHPGGRADDPVRQRALAQTHYDLATVLAPQAGREAEAEQAYRESLRVLDALHARAPEDLEVQRELARTLNNLAIHLRVLGRADAEPTFVRAAALQRKLAGSRSASRRDRHLLARTLTNLGAFRLAAQDYSGAEQHYREARDLWQKLRDDFPSTPLYQQDLALAHHNLGLLYRAWKRPVQACAEFESAIRLRERLANDAPSKENRFRLANSQTSFAVYLRETGQADAAATWFRAAHGTLSDLLGQKVGLPEHEAALGVACYNWGRLCAEQERFAEAEPLAREAAEHLRNARMSRQEHRPYQEQLCEALTLLAIVRVELKDHVRAAEAAEELPRVRPDDYSQLVRAARFLSQCAGLAPADASQGLRETYARRALQHLQKALAGGYKGLDQLKTEPDFEPLRARRDFQDLLKHLEERVKQDIG